MRATLVLLAGLLLALGGTQFAVPSQAAGSQAGPYPNGPSSSKPDDEGPRLPNGKLQRDAILKHDLRRNIKDLREIRGLSDELIDELEDDTAFVLSIKSLKKLQRIEKLSKDIQKRLRK